jgi:hypothetical protein
LAAAGFLLSGVGDAPATDATTIRFAEGNESAAELVAAHLVGPSVLTPDAAVEGVLLVMGHDWKGVSETAKEPPPTTTTSAAPDATTTTSAEPATTATAAPAPAC